MNTHFKNTDLSEDQDFKIYRLAFPNIVWIFDV